MRFVGGALRAPRDSFFIFVFIFARRAAGVYQLSLRRIPLRAVLDGPVIEQLLETFDDI